MNTPTNDTTAAASAAVTITEADVLAFLRAQNIAINARFNGGFVEGTVNLTVHPKSQNPFAISGYLGTDYATARHVFEHGETIAAAIETFRKNVGDRDSQAKQLREQAAKLLAEAEKLTSHAEKIATAEAA